MQSDPIGLEGGENSFVYVGDNPLSRVDESGLVNPLLATCPAGGPFNPMCDAGLALEAAMYAITVIYVADKAVSAEHVDTDSDSNIGSTCSEKYPTYIKASELYYYDYYTEKDAFLYFGGSKEAKKGKRAKAQRGPCVMYSGNHEHINILDKKFGYYLGSIRSCECCVENSGNPTIIKKYRTYDDE